MTRLNNPSYDVTHPSISFLIYTYIYYQLIFPPYPCTNFFFPFLPPISFFFIPPGPSTGAIKEQMDFFTKTLPDNFQMLSIMELAEPLLNQESSPYVVVALQECQRMNILLSEIRRSLIELDKGAYWTTLQCIVLC